jgi:hypothetical protein
MKAGSGRSRGRGRGRAGANQSADYRPAVKRRAESYESIIKVIDHLQGQCIYCTIIIEEQRPIHTYNEYIEVVVDGCGYEAY